MLKSLIGYMEGQGIDCSQLYSEKSSALSYFRIPAISLDNGAPAYEQSFFVMCYTMAPWMKFLLPTTPY